MVIWIDDPHLTSALYVNSSCENPHVVDLRIGLTLVCSHLLVLLRTQAHVLVVIPNEDTSFSLNRLSPMFLYYYVFVIWNGDFLYFLPSDSQNYMRLFDISNICRTSWWDG